MQAPFIIGPFRSGILLFLILFAVAGGTNWGISRSCGQSSTVSRADSFSSDAYVPIQRERRERAGDSLTKNEKSFALGETTMDNRVVGIPPYAYRPIDGQSVMTAPMLIMPEDKSTRGSTSRQQLFDPFQSYMKPDTIPSLVPPPVPESLVIRHYPSYSYDSREWAEFHSLVPTAPVRETETRTATDMDSPEMETEHIGMLIATSLRVDFSPDGRKHIDQTSKIDLTPSYSNQLVYTSIRGVVVVQANFPLSEIESILHEIEVLQRDLNVYMGVPAPREKIELCLFKNEKTYFQFLRDKFPRAPSDRRALYIKINEEPGTLLVQRSKDFEVDLRHEMTHAIIHASIRHVPIWLDEGLAKYFELPSQDRSLCNPYMKIIRWNTKFGAVPSIQRLEKLENIGHMGGREYRDSWAWIHFMIHHSRDTHRLLAGYLAMLATVSDREPQKSDVASSVEIPSLGPYLQELLKNPREKYREHFQTWGNDE